MLSELKRELLERRLRGERVTTTGRNAEPAIVPVRRGGQLPLSFAQQRLWFLAQLEPDSVEYNAPMVVRWPAPLDVAVLSGALRSLVARHEVLRTRLPADESGEPYQVIDPPPAEVPVPVVDVSAEDDPGAAAERLVAAVGREPFDLAAGPLVRFSVVRISPEEHLVVLAMHHVVGDEWSVGIIRDELTALYEGRKLPELPVQYADFAVWQREWLSGRVLESQLGYWRGLLAGAPVLELPTDRPRPAVRSSAGAVIEFSVPAEVADGLKALSRTAGASMFMTLLSAYTVVLSRYCGQTDLVVGTPIAGRNRAEIEGLVGFFVNTLVLRTDLSGDPSFSELLGRVRERTLAAYAHQDLPFERLVDELGVDRDRSRTPLFQALFNYFTQDTTDAPQQGDSVSEPMPSTAKYDLTLTLGETGGGLRGALQYSTALFDDDRMVELVGHVREVLAAVARNASTPLSRLPILTGGELDRLAEWNATEAPVWEVGGVHELVEAQPPGSVAVVCGGVELTYAELDERANRLAHHLRGLGVRAERVVGLCLPRGVDQVVALLAVWKAGGAYLPLDPDYPAERLAFLIGDSGAAVVVADREVDAGGVPLVRLGDPAIVAQPSTGCGVVSDPRQLAYVIYTSGSTGRPKGVLSAHRGLVNRLTWMQDRHALAPGERVLHKTPLTFDVSLWELLWPLTTGGCLVLAEPGRQGDLGYLVELIEERQISVAHFVPSLFHQFVEHPWSAPMSRLRLVVCSGEALNAGDVARFYARHATATVEDLYGPTEASIEVSCWSCPRPGGSAAMPIGAPIANVRLYVLDQALNPVPAGVTGELYIGGIGLARGYAGRPELSAERFIADPFTPGARLYRTGDLARWRADGNVFYLGRADHQVKVRGFRIEPGEIEAALRRHPAVAAAVVVAAEGRLVAYLVPADPAAGVPAPGVLRDHLRDSLPAYMVPAVFVELSVLPLNSSGKVDRAALPAPDGARPDLVSGFVAPRTVTEELLAGIWAQLLGVDRVGVLDDFFELGGHSLLATRVAAQVRAKLGAEVTVAALFDRPTVAGLAEMVEEAGRSVPAPPIVAVGRDEPLPLSFAQQRLWFLAQLDPGSVEYIVPVVLPWPGALDPAVLGRALGALVGRHEVLRTRLVSDAGGVAHQVIDPAPAEVAVPVVDVSAEPDPESAVDRLIAAAMGAPFDLAAGPLLRASAVRLTADRHIAGAGDAPCRR